MLFKILLIGGLAFYLFRMITVKPKIKSAPKKEKIKKKNNDDYVDYEEID